MINNYAYSEVLDIMDNMEEKYKEMLPQKLIEFLNENADSKYQKHVNPRISLSKQNISKDAITILAMINLKYWVKDEEHKAELIEKYKVNNTEISNNELKDIFESNNIDNNSTVDDDYQETDINKSLVLKKYGFIERIKNWFSRFRKKENNMPNNDNHAVINERKKTDFRTDINLTQTTPISLKYKLKSGEISIDELSDSELDDIIKYYEETTKEKMKKLQMENAS